MDIPTHLITYSNSQTQALFSRPSIIETCGSRNLSASPSPLPTPVPTQPTLLLISYDRRKPPAVRFALDYNLKPALSVPKHLRVLPETGLSLAIAHELFAQPYLAQQLERAQREIKEEMTRLQMKIAFSQRPDSCSSGEVVDGWVEEITSDRSDDIQSAAALHSPPDEVAVVGSGSLRDQQIELGNGVLWRCRPDQAPVLRVGSHCVSGCHESVVFVEELARKMWPFGWAVNVEHHTLSLAS